MSERTRTPIFKRPSHDDRENKSIVFHRDIMGEEVVIFKGDNHREDAISYCEMYGEDDGSRKRNQVTP